MLPRLVTKSQLALLPTSGGVTRLLTCPLHLSAPLASKKAGRHKPSKTGDKPLTYEQSNKPDEIGVRKSFNSINSSSLVFGINRPQIAHEDIFIRKFLHGTWPSLLGSDVIIKRKANQILLNFMVIRMIAPHKIYFLIGYTEEILSYMLKCVVKIQVQTIENLSDMTYKYI